MFATSSHEVRHRLWNRAVELAKSDRVMPMFSAFIALYVLVQAHLRFTVREARTVSVDEGYIAAFALRLLHGEGLPYVDAVSQRGPLTYWLAMLAQAFDETSFLPMRILALVIALSAALATFRLGVLIRGMFAGALALVAFVLTTTVIMGAHAGIGYNAEFASLPFTLTGVLSSLLGVRSRRLGWIAGAGVLLSLGALCKQLALLLIVPVAVLCWRAWSDAPRGARFRSLGALCLGASLPLMTVGVVYALAGHFQELWYWAVTYNATVYMAPITWAYRQEFMLRWLHSNTYSLIIWGAMAAWAASKRGDVAFVAAAGFMGIAAALAPARPWENYYLYAVPWFALLFASMVDELVAPIRIRQGLMVGACAIAAIAFYQQLRTWNRGEVDRRWRDLQIPSVCAFIERETPAHSSLFVWGFLGEYYVECGRLPASRYVIPAPVAGWVPWFPALSIAQEDELAAPGSRETLIRELGTSKPGVIIDAPHASMAGRSMTRYALLRQFLQTNYRARQRFGDMTAYVRREGH